MRRRFARRSAGSAGRSGGASDEWKNMPKTIRVRRRTRTMSSNVVKGGVVEATAATEQPAFSGRTAWVRNLETPLRTFLRTETGSAAVLLGAVLAALVWANVDMGSYARVWQGTAYAETIHAWPLVIGIGIFGVIVACVLLQIRRGPLYALLGIVGWVALSRSGVDPIVIGLAMGLLTWAAPVARTDLERASDLFRLFREQPTPELARTARAGLRTALSPNERLQGLFHPWTSYVIVPVFALANAGIALSGGFLGRAFTSPITLGILVGYVAGKPIGITGTTWLVTKASGGRLHPPIGWAALAGGGAIAGIGFTVSLLISDLAFTGDRLDQAKAGILSAALVSSLATWLVFRATILLPQQRRLRAFVE